MKPRFPAEGERQVQLDTAAAPELEVPSDSSSQAEVEEEEGTPVHSIQAEVEEEEGTPVESIGAKSHTASQPEVEVQPATSGGAASQRVPSATEVVVQPEDSGFLLQHLDGQLELPISTVDTEPEVRVGLPESKAVLEILSALENGMQLDSITERDDNINNRYDDNDKAAGQLYDATEPKVMVWSEVRPWRKYLRGYSFDGFLEALSVRHFMQVMEEQHDPLIDV